MTTPAAELMGVSKTFGRGVTLVRALKDVSLRIHAGELTLIEGPSGSGKTTLLHILGLLQRADTGQVRVGGRRMDLLPESGLPDERRRNVVLIFQGYNLLDALTVYDNVDLGSLLTHGSFRSAPVAQYLRRLDIERRAEHLPAQLSGGEKQRTAIARALACRGRLVLADEPTANLDWDNGQHIVRCLADLAHNQGRAVVMVSHDSRLEPFADRIVGLVDGHISDDRQPRGAAVSTANQTTPEEPPTDVGRRGLTYWPIVLIALMVLVLLGWAVGNRIFAARQPAPEAAPARPVVASTPYTAAAPAVVEPSTHLVALRSERRGRIKAILKQAGEPIERGEPLILLDDATVEALVSQRRADLKLSEANLARLEAWDRPEERAKARASVDGAQARLDRADRELQRVQSLYEQTVASETEFNLAVEEQRLAAAALEEARQIAAISAAGPTPEQLRVAQARVEQARAALHMAETELSLLTVRSPLDGHVIYRHLEPGEVVDPESPVPILSVGNLDQVRLRAEVDEADIQRVTVGQRIVATAEAFGDRQITGRVVHLEAMMGRKTIRTQRTTEQQDTKVREVLIELDPDTPPLPIDLQMTVRFIAPTDQPAGEATPAGR